jgi:asparagine synthetase B (glutamine-hydrolysing)
MCGIAGIYVKGDVGKFDLDAMLSTMLLAIEHRGGDATGFVALTDEGVGRWQKAACGAKDFNIERRRVPKDARTILGHTRWATQGHQGFMENNHPIKRGPFFLIHNGHIYNDNEVFVKAGRERYGLVDSECIVADLANHGSLTALPKVMEGLDGAAAVAVVDERFPREMALARGESSPLFVLETRRLILFASTEKCVFDAHKKHVGDVKTKAVKEIESGTFIHIKDGKAKLEQFTMPKRKGYSWMGSLTSFDDDGLDFNGRYKAKSPLPSVNGLSANGQTVLQALIDNVDWTNCDVCNVEYHHERMEQVMDGEELLTLCPVCYDWLNDPLEDDEAIDANPLDVRFRV